MICQEVYLEQKKMKTGCKKPFFFLNKNKNNNQKEYREICTPFFLFLGMSRHVGGQLIVSTIRGYGFHLRGWNVSGVSFGVISGAILSSIATFGERLRTCGSLYGFNELSTDIPSQGGDCSRRADAGELSWKKEQWFQGQQNQ